MKVVQINASCGKGSTGKICTEIADLLNKEGIVNRILYTNGGSSHPSALKYGNGREIRSNAVISRVAGNYGFNSKGMTKKLIKELEELSPNIIHLHNIHGHNCDVKALFEYLKSTSARFVWTFHDCWAFTGYCMYFDSVQCEKWKTGCFDCPQRKKYSLIFDKSKKLYDIKKSLFSELDMTIVTPSVWLAKLVKESFLRECPVRVINNGIDLDAFSYTESGFREKYGIPSDKTVLLGVAYKWEARKGIGAFIKAANELKDTCRVVLIGGMDDKVKRELPENVICISRTSDRRELAGIYSAADYLINPTSEDNFPTVNIEALACGTPVITYDTGGSAEIIDSSCGAVVPDNSAVALIRLIREFGSTSPFSRADCRRRAESFNKDDKFKEYIQLYRELSNE